MNNSNRIHPNIIDPAIFLKTAPLQSPHQIISSNAKKYLNHTAVIDNNFKWSYGDIDKYSNQIANALIKNNINAGDNIVVYTDRCALLVVSLLGILKSGATFIIFDSSYPVARLKTYLNICNPKGFINLTNDTEFSNFINDHLNKKGNIFYLKLNNLDTIINNSYLSSYSDDDPEVDYNMDQAAYIMFTSGSTGQPKAIATNLTPLSHFISWHIKTFKLSHNDRFTMLSGLAHDPILRDIFTPLCLGAKLYIPDSTTFIDPRKLVPWMIKNNITVSHITPAMSNLLTQITPEITEESTDISKIESLRYCFFGGDLLIPSDLKKFKNIAPNVSCVNFYGATETPQAMSYQVITDDMINNETNSLSSIPVGHGIDNVQLLILDNDFSICQIGDTGEIYIRSPYLSLGYLNDSSSTNDRFITNPFTKIPEDRLYKTGDKGRYLSNGAIEHLGRKDNQVKIRGFRIELDEIKFAIKKFEGINDAVVIASEITSLEKRIVAYYSLLKNKNILFNERGLRKFLIELLPNYMIPSHFIKLDLFSLTPNGKINKDLLPKPEQAVKTEVSVDFPIDDIEKRITNIWYKLLKISPIGRNSNFFEIGGNSLMVIQIIGKVNAQFNSDIEPAQLFDKPTIAGMAQLIRTFNHTDNSKVSSLKVVPFQNINESIIMEKIGLDKFIFKMKDIFKDRNTKSLKKTNNNIYRMRESFICKYILSPLYSIKRGSIRSILEKLILKLEGGAWFTITLRKLYKKFYDMDIGDYSSFCFNVGNFKPTTSFGRYCDITRTARFETAQHPVNTISSHGVFYQQDLGFSNGYNIPRNKIKVGNDVHIGHNVIILYPAKEIGDGAIIGAGAIVNFDIPPYAIVAGYPAKIIRYRFSKEIIDKLLEIKWWEATLEELEPLKDEFIKPVVGRFIR